MQKIGATGDGKSAVATPDGKKPKEEQDYAVLRVAGFAFPALRSVFRGAC